MRINRLIKVIFFIMVLLNIACINKMYVIYADDIFDFSNEYISFHINNQIMQNYNNGKSDEENFNKNTFSDSYMLKIMVKRHGEDLCTDYIYIENDDVSETDSYDENRRYIISNIQSRNLYKNLIINEYNKKNKYETRSISYEEYKNKGFVGILRQDANDIKAEITINLEENEGIKTEPDYYVFNNVGGEINVVYNDEGVLSNDNLSNLDNTNVIASIYIDNQNVVLNENGEYVLYSKYKEKIGVITDFDPKGGFSFIPENGFIGQSIFYYTYIDESLEQSKNEKIVISVLPKVTAKYYSIPKKNSESYTIDDTLQKSCFEELTVTKYGVPKMEDPIQNLINAIISLFNKGDWPGEIVCDKLGIVKPTWQFINYYSEYTFGNLDIDGYAYVGCVNRNDKYVLKLNKEESIDYTFKTINEDLEFYYVQNEDTPKITVQLIDYIKKGKIVPNDIIISKEKKETYDIKPNDYPFDRSKYKYCGIYKIGDDSEIVSEEKVISGDWPSEDVTITLYFKRICDYKVQYYLNGQPNSDLDVHGKALEDDTLSGTIDSYRLSDLEEEGWEIEKIEPMKSPVSTDSNHNVIEVYYKKTLDIYTGVYVKGNENTEEEGFLDVNKFVPKCCYPFAVKIVGNGKYKINITSDDADIVIISNEINNGKEVSLNAENKINIVKYYLSAKPNSKTEDNKFHLKVSVVGDLNVEYMTGDYSFVEESNLE